MKLFKIAETEKPRRASKPKGVEFRISLNPSVLEDSATSRGPHDSITVDNARMRVDTISGCRSPIYLELMDSAEKWHLGSIVLSEMNTRKLVEALSKALAEREEFRRKHGKVR
jgi:hypothetical protein